jgi:hypothetical protein
MQIQAKVLGLGVQVFIVATEKPDILKLKQTEKHTFTKICLLKCGMSLKVRHRSESITTDTSKVGIVFQ